MTTAFEAKKVVDWGDFGTTGTSLSGGKTVNFDGMQVTVGFVDENGGSKITTSNDYQYRAPGEAFDPCSALRLYGAGGDGCSVDSTSTTSISFAAVSGSGFADQIQDISFRINDIDIGSNWSYHKDVVTLRAYDAAGNLIPVTITASPYLSVSGATISGKYDSINPGDAKGSALITIAGPVARIEIDYNNAGSSAQAIWVTDMHYTTIAAPTLDGIVQGTDADDLIDLAYDADPHGDRIDANDALLPGHAPNDDVVRAGAGNDTVFAGLGNDTVHGEAGNDELHGQAGDDWLDGGDGDDLLFGGAGNDVILGGAGNDVIWGDNGGEDGSAPSGNLAAPLSLQASNVKWGSQTGIDGSANVGDSVIYLNVTVTEDGRDVAARLVLVERSSSLKVDLTGGPGAEILLNGNNDPTDGGKTASFRLEFFDQATGAPIEISSIATFGDLDRTATPERVTISADQFSAYGTAAQSSLLITTGTGTVTASGSEQNDPSDQDAWFSAAFESRSYIEFTLTTRDVNSGFTLNGAVIDHPVLVDLQAGNDTLMGGEGNDTIYGEAGDDLLYGDDGDDLLFGGTGNDTLYGGAGSDTIHGGPGADLIYGGSGDDVIVGMTSGSVAHGGDDRDTFAISAPISDGGQALVDGGEGGDDWDRLDLRGSGPFTIVYSDSTDAETKNGTVIFRNEAGEQTGTLEFRNIEEVIPCFTPGTLVATPRGERLVEELRAGDRVITRDNGIQDIRWVGRRTLSRAELALAPHLKPVMIRAGSLGNCLPERDMLVSPNHRMLVANDKTSLYFEEHEVLVAAKHLINHSSVKPVETLGTTYLHFMFDRHEVVLANGAWTESFMPGDYSLGGMGNAQRSEIFELFPDLKTPAGLENYTAARRTLRRHEAVLLG